MHISRSESPQALGPAVAWSIGLVPVAMVLTTWDDKLSYVQLLSRFFFVPMLLTEVAVILFLLRRGLGVGKAPTPILACLFALLAIAWGGAIGSGSGYSLVQTSTWMVHLLFGFSIAALAAREEAFADQLVKAMLAGFLLFAFLFLLYVALRYDPAYDWRNDSPAFAHIRWFGFYGEAIFGLCAWGWLRGRKGYALIAILALAMPLWTGSRAVIPAVIGGYLVACLFFPFARAAWRRFAGIFALAVVLGMVASWLVPLGDVGPYRSGDSGRVELWAQALGFIAERPWFGWGEGRFTELSHPLAYTHPHQVILQILLAWGVIGALLVAVMMGWLALRIHRTVDEGGAPFLFAALMLAAASLVDGTLYLNQSTALFAMCVAVLYARSASRASVHAPSPGPARASALAGAVS